MDAKTRAAVFTDDDSELEKIDKFRGLVAVTLGGGAFACENLRTALQQLAEHVTVIHRTDLQCW